MKQDITMALRWVRKAAEQGDADAQFNVGVRYLLGDGIAKSEIQISKQ